MKGYDNGIREGGKEVDGEEESCWSKEVYW